MKVLAIYAHPNPKSYNHAVLESFTRGLKDGGNTCEVIDLYASGFNPSLKGDDFAQFAGKPMPQDVLEHQSKVNQADALAFIFPIWFSFYPAILKGWIERVLCHGFAYQYVEQGVKGLLKHQKAVLISTTGGPEPAFKMSGNGSAIHKLNHAIFKEACGIQQIEHIFLYSVQRCDDATRKKYLEQVYTLGKSF
jgi:NAD(P)H dehydrogenase (quinone)